MGQIFVNSQKVTIFAKAKKISLSMSYIGNLNQPDEYRRDELIRIIERSVERLTLQELEALYYDMSTKNFIND